MKLGKYLIIGAIFILALNFVLNFVSCLEWSEIFTCPEGTVCVNGSCESIPQKVIVKFPGGEFILLEECGDKSYMTNTADYIIQGTVEKVRGKCICKENTTQILTYVDVKIEKYIKGTPLGTGELQIITPGGCCVIEEEDCHGNIGEEICAGVEDTPILHEGKRVILYLRKVPKEFREFGEEFSIVCGNLGVEEIPGEYHISIEHTQITQSNNIFTSLLSYVKNFFYETAGYATAQELLKPEIDDCIASGKSEETCTKLCEEIVIDIRGKIPKFENDTERNEWFKKLDELGDSLREKQSLKEFKYPEGPVISYGYSVYGYFFVDFKKGFEYNETITEEIYEIIDEEAKKLGIEDIPVVFRISDIPELESKTDILSGNEKEKNEVNMVIIFIIGVIVGVLIGIMSKSKKIKRKHLLLASIFGLILAIILIVGYVLHFPTEEMQFIDMTEQLSCIVAQNNEYIINSEQEYRGLLNHKASVPECANFQLPPINFSQYTLLGKYAYGSGCSVNFEKRVYRDEANKKIIFFIKVNEEGPCEMLVEKMDWVLVQKIPPEYSVVFKVER